MALNFEALILRCQELCKQVINDKSFDWIPGDCVVISRVVLSRLDTDPITRLWYPCCVQGELLADGIRVFHSWCILSVNGVLLHVDGGALVDAIEWTDCKKELEQIHKENISYEDFIGPFKRSIKVAEL